MPFHFNIAREDLLRAIGAQQNITSKKGTLAILSNVLLEVDNNNIIFTGTDLEIGLKQTVPAEVFETGFLTLPAKKLFEVARESGSSIISFKEEDKNWVEITAGTSIYKLAGMVSEEFPQFPDYDEVKMVEIEAAVIADLIDKTVFSIAQDKETVFSLTAALLQKHEENGKKMFRMVSSDGHRLSIMSKETESAAQLQLNPVTLIPRRGIQEIRKFTEEKDIFKLGIEKKQAVLKSDDSLLIIRIMEGEFPNFENLLNVISMDNVIQINRIRFLES
jgi:DNA polymerase-3 subunit beta